MVPKSSFLVSYWRCIFKASTFNRTCEKGCSDVYYLFKRATLRWRLFKRQALIEGKPKRRYKRPSGTRWVEHQVQNLDSHNYNLSILIAFLNQQISDPYNQSIRKVKSTFQGIKTDLCHTDRILFNCSKQDVLAIIQPLSKSLQDSKMNLPSLISNCSRTMRTITKLNKLIHNEDEGV